MAINFFLEPLLIRIDMLDHERFEPPLEIFCFLAEFEIHANHLSITQRRTQLFDLLNRLTRCNLCMTTCSAR